MGLSNPETKSTQDPTEELRSALLSCIAFWLEVTMTDVIL